MQWRGHVPPGPAAISCSPSPLVRKGNEMVLRQVPCDDWSCRTIAVCLESRWLWAAQLTAIVALSSRPAGTPGHCNSCGCSPESTPAAGAEAAADAAGAEEAAAAEAGGSGASAGVAAGGGAATGRARRQASISRSRPQAAKSSATAPMCTSRGSSSSVVTAEASAVGCSLAAPADGGSSVWLILGQKKKANLIPLGTW